ncbi:MAG: hypothetical protein U0165_05720 [Polyangiaceae bacterium]
MDPLLPTLRVEARTRPLTARQSLLLGDLAADQNRRPEGPEVDQTPVDRLAGDRIPVEHREADRIQRAGLAEAQSLEVVHLDHLDHLDHPEAAQIQGEDHLEGPAEDRIPEVVHRLLEALPEEVQSLAEAHLGHLAVVQSLEVVHPAAGRILVVVHRHPEVQVGVQNQEVGQRGEDRNLVAGPEEVRSLVEGHPEHREAAQIQVGDHREGLAEDRTPEAVRLEEGRSPAEVLQGVRSLRQVMRRTTDKTCCWGG